MFATVIHWPFQVVGLFRDLVRIVRPTYPEARSRYWSAGKSYELFELPDHVEKALSYIKASGGTLDYPDFKAALEFFDAECQRHRQDPWGRPRRKVRATLARWGRQANRRSSNGTGRRVQAAATARVTTGGSYVS